MRNGTYGPQHQAVVYSLNVVDEARLLAVGFHQLVERFVKAEIPIWFIHFPRIVLDHDYLFTKLRELLPAGTTLEQSKDAFESVVDIRRSYHEVP